MKRKYSYWMAPAVSAAILLLVYAAYGLFPFGSGTISWCDMNQQVIPFLMDFKDIMSGKANMFLNMQNAGGMSFWGVFLFFISSPFSFLVLLVSKEKIYFLVNIMLLLKVMLCSLTSCGFMLRRFRSLSAMQASAVSVMYAFCGYMMFYYQNIVWLDTMCLFPLLLIGLDKLVHEGKPLFYTLIFAAILTVNFYLSYMVVIFMILAMGTYFLFCVPKNERKKKAFIFGLSTLTSGLMTGVVWVPSFMQYLSSARTGNLVASLRSGAYFTRINTTVPVITCTAAACAAVIFAVVFMRKYWENSTAWLSCMLFLMLVPVFIQPVNKMWHTGSYQSFPVRYGYITIFLGLIMLAVCISWINRETRIPEQKGHKTLSCIIAVATMAAVAFCSAVILQCSFKDVTVYTRTLSGSSGSLVRLLIFALCAMFAYLILLLEYHYGKIEQRVFSVLLCALTVTEALFYSSVYIGSARNNADYYEPIMDLSGRIMDSSLYHVKMDSKYFDVNLIGGMGYPSLSHYTSLTSRDYLFAMKKLGYSSYWMEVGSSGGTELTDAVLGNKYSIVRTDSRQSGQKPVYSNGLYSVVENKNSLPAGIIMKSGSVQSLKRLPDMTRFNMQQYIFQSVFSSKKNLIEEYQPVALKDIRMDENGKYRLLLESPYREGTVLYRIPVKGTQTLYFDCFDRLGNYLVEPLNSSFSITVNGKMIDIKYPSQSSNGIYRLGTFTNQTVGIEIGVQKNVYAKSFGVAGLKEDALSEAVADTKSASLRQSGNSIIGTAAADSSDEYLFLPVQYSNGFSAEINGRHVPVLRVFDTFMAVKLEKGNNKVKISYIPDGFLQGTVVSICGAAALLLLIVAFRKGWPERAKHLQSIFAALFAALFVFTILAVYILPVIIYLT